MGKRLAETRSMGTRSIGTLPRGGLRWRRRSAERDLDEAYRTLRASTAAVLAEEPHPVLMVASPNSGEGRTFTSVHLAAAFALSGRRTVLADFDLRRPDAHRPVGGHNDFGVLDVLEGRRTLQESLQTVELPSIRPVAVGFLAAGRSGSDPGTVLDQGAVSELLAELAARSDMVVLDTAPVLAVADALVLGRFVSGALLVAAFGATRFPDLERTRDLLIRNRTTITGVVLNKAPGGYGSSRDGADQSSGPPVTPGV